MKKGITMTSLVVYIVLLAAFTGIALMVSSNLSDSVFSDKGVSINMASYEKAMYYLNKSAMESTSVTVTDSSVTFSNGDAFEYDDAKNELKMNGGILCKNISKFSVGNVENNLLNIEIGLKKYTNTMERTITLNVGE